MIAVLDIHHSDEGIQYAACDSVDLLTYHGVLISLAGVGKAEENGHVGRFAPTIKKEEADLSEYYPFLGALGQICRLIDDVCTTKCIYSSLGYLWQSSLNLLGSFLSCRRLPLRKSEKVSR
jgi:putative transposase